MIHRNVTSYLKSCFKKYPVVTVTGPRQSGKTTLVRNTFPRLPYVNLENLETRQYATDDPQRFLNEYSAGAIFDEIQNVPGLTSWIQVHIDEIKKNSMFVLTGSRQFEVMETVSQSLAGRTAIIRLLPFSYQEIKGAFLPDSVDNILYTGFYPRLFDQKIEPVRALADYLATYIERDIRKITHIHNLSLFQKFIGLCAGRTGQIVNLVSLGNDTGISHTTASEWLSILEASYTVFLLRPYFTNTGKRLIKSPKLYFYDVGLASHLLGIENHKHVKNHPLRGNLFENFIILDILKQRYNRGLSNNLFFFRESSGYEVDLIYLDGGVPFPVEIKSGETISSEYFKGLEYFQKNFSAELTAKRGLIIYAGKNIQNRQNFRICGYHKLDTVSRFISSND
ncbi:MAG TPA: AAA family ATPase [Spirochaetia bacterium]|nr:AAA family ATPase [Spirochaetia bacterium]